MHLGCRHLVLVHYGLMWPLILSFSQREKERGSDSLSLWERVG